METFIITYDNLQRFKSSASIDKLEALRDYFLKYIMEYHKNRNDWIENLISRLSNLAEILQIFHVVLCNYTLQIFKLKLLIFLR